MDQAATELGLASKIRWGGAWDRVLSDFGGSIDSYREECEAYAKRHPGKDFLDGPHFEWVGRSEEHTSELQSLMRISYAVFCLKKKNILQSLYVESFITCHHPPTFNDYF